MVMTLFHNLGIHDPERSAQRRCMFSITSKYVKLNDICLPPAFLTKVQAIGQKCCFGSTHWGLIQPLRLFLSQRNDRLWEMSVSDTFDITCWSRILQTPSFSSSRSDNTVDSQPSVSQWCCWPEVSCLGQMEKTQTCALHSGTMTPTTETSTETVINLTMWTFSRNP